MPHLELKPTAGASPPPGADGDRPDPELNLGAAAAPKKPLQIVHLPKLWTTEWSTRVSWATKNHDQHGREISRPPPLPLQFEESAPDRKCTLMIGGMEGSRSKKFIEDRHLTVSEIRLLAGLLSMRQPWEEEFSVERLGLRDLYRRVKTGPNPKDMAGGDRIQALREDLEHLETYWVLLDRPWITDSDSAHRVAEKLVQFRKATRYLDRKPHTEANIQSEWIEAFSINPNFLRALDENSRAIRLDIFNSFESDMIRLWYLVIPALASHDRIDVTDPWKRDLRWLFATAGCAIGSWKAKNWRFERCSKHVAALDGAPTMNGRFRCVLKENSDRDDFQLHAWIERSKVSRGKVHYNSDGYLFTYWLQSGRSREEFEEKLRRGLGPLDSREIDLLTLCQYNYRQAGNHSFLRQIKAIIGEAAFAMALSHAKSSVQSYVMIGGCQPGRIVGTVLKDFYKRALAR